MKNKFLLSAAALAGTCLLILISCGKSSPSGYTPPPPPGGGTDNNISIYNMAFSPSSKTVAKGATVKWTNKDSYAHTVTSNDGITFNSSSMGAGATYSYTASTEGTFPYHCTIHGMTMSGTLVVTP